MIDLSENYIQALLWSTALWLAVPLLISLLAKQDQPFRDTHDREARAINLGFWLFEAMALGPLLWLLSRYWMDAVLNVWVALGDSLNDAAASGRSADMPKLIIGFLLALWLGDGLAALRHRLEHTRYLWRFHAWHHTVDASDWLQTHRHHPVSRLIAFFGEVLVLAAILALFLGSIPWLAMLAAMACRRAYAIWLHAGSNWGMGSWLARHLVLPGHHRAHHAGAPIFSGMFRHWDYLWHFAKSR